MSDVNTWQLGSHMSLIKSKVAVRTTDDLVICAIIDLGYATGSVARKYQAHQDFFRGQVEPSTETTSLVAGWFQMQ